MWCWRRTMHTHTHSHSQCVWVPPPFGLVVRVNDVLRTHCLLPNAACALRWSRGQGEWNFWRRRHLSNVHFVIIIFSNEISIVLFGDEFVAREGESGEWGESERNQETASQSRHQHERNERKMTNSRHVTQTENKCHLLFFHLWRVLPRTHTLTHFVHRLCGGRKVFVETEKLNFHKYSKWNYVKSFLMASLTRAVAHCRYEKLFIRSVYGKCLCSGDSVRSALCQKYSIRWFFGKLIFWLFERKGKLSIQDQLTSIRCSYCFLRSKNLNRFWDKCQNE